MTDNTTINPHKVKKLKSNVYNFLEKYRVGGGSEIKYTHVSMGDSFLGKFNLDKKASKEFIKIYSEAVNYGINFCIAEKPKDYGPLIVDIDLELPIDDFKNNRLYTYDMIISVINAYRLSIKKYLDVTSSELEVCLCEKECATLKTSVVKDGFHLFFNNICAHYKLRHLIRNNVIKLLSDNSLFLGFTNSINKIIDEAVVSTNCWLMYGSKKNDGYLYSLTKILNNNNEEMNIEKYLDEKNLCIKMFSLQQKIWSDDNSQPYLENIVSEDIDEEYNKLYERSYNKIQLGDTPISENKEDDIRRARILVSLLSEDRAHDYSLWIRLGWALHNIDVSLINTWIDFSKTSNKYKDGECEKFWYRMRDEGLTIRSLMLWAEQDNYSKYHQFIATEFNDVLNKSLDGSTYYISKALYTKYINKFVCASLDNNVWYEFRNHRWFKVSHGYTLQREISESFANEYSKLVSKYSLKATQVSGLERDEINGKVTKIQKIVIQLMNISFKEKIMKECKNLFFDPEFEEKLDENYDLIGFNNGVYDLEHNEFREGRPDDFISKSTNNDYYDFNPKNPYCNKLLQFFKEILPNESVREYLLLSLSTCVSGHNKEEKLRIATGSGSNGKSLLFNLVQLALGDYYISCPITIITRKRGSSNQASPELLRLKGARCGCFQETDSDEKLNVGIMKEITGNDRFMVRGLFADPIEIKPQIKFFLACNQLPELPSVDGGVKRRLVNILFGSKFVENPSKPNEFLIDNTLKEKIKEWGPIFVSYLIYKYINEYKKINILTEPEEIKITTESYIAENDHFTEFFINRIVFTNNKKDSIGIKAMYEDFKAWFKSSHEGAKVPVQIDLNKFLIEKIGETKKNKWYCYTFNNTEEENSDNDSTDLNDNNKQVKNALDA